MRRDTKTLDSIVKRGANNAIVAIDGIPVHWSANIVPFAGDIERLAKSISQVGQLDAITTYRGEIIDGRRRASAMALIDVEPRFEDLYTIRGEMTTDELYSVVLAKNNRRDLNSSQKALIAAGECQLGRHTMMGYKRATEYASEVWGIGNSLYSAAVWLTKNASIYALRMFENGEVIVARKKFKSVMSLKKFLEAEPNTYDEGEIDVARAKGIFATAFDMASKNIKIEHINKGLQLATNEFRKDK